MEENGGTGLAVGKNVTPDIKMSLPEGIHYTQEGPRYYDAFGKSSSLHNDALKEPQFHDWMKDYAKNLRQTVGENAILPKGTQELLDAPYSTEGNAALGRYLEGKYPGKYTNPTLTSFIPDSEGRLNFRHGDNQFGMVMRSSVQDNLTPKGLQIGSPVEMKTIAGAPRRMPLQKATAATQAKIAGSIAMETVEDNVGRVIQRSGATSRLLGAATEASAHVAGGAAKSGLLRQAAAAATILKTIT